MSAREKLLAACYDDVIVNLESAAKSIGQANHLRLMNDIKIILAKVQKLRDTMAAYSQDDRNHKSSAKWISASNPPEEGKRVLVMLTTGEVWAGHYDGENWIAHVMGSCNSITHWMQNPKLTKD